MAKNKKADKINKAVAVKAKAKTKAPEVETVEVEIEDPTVEVEVDIEDMGPADEEVAFADDSTALVPLLHRLLDVVQTKTAIPAVHEVCSCGASLTISDNVPEPDRKRMYNAFLRRHKPCLAGVSTDED